MMTQSMWVILFFFVSNMSKFQKKGERQHSSFGDKENTHTHGRTDGRTEAKSRANNELLWLLFSFFYFLLLLLCGGVSKKKKKHSSQQKRRI